MTRITLATIKSAALAGAAAALLSACNAADRIADVGEAPGLTPIQNPVERPDYTPVRMPMPAPQVVEQNANSLWQSGSRAFFRDQRAGDVGDILTVLINIDDEAQLNNSSERTRTNSEGAAIPNFLGIEAEQLARMLPEAFEPENAVELSSNSASQGEGQIRRNEEITLRLAAVVTEVLPNGNLAIFGRQEIQVNFERRDLVVAGVIRPEDITSGNTIGYEQIAEARVSYGGEGQMTDVQQPRYGQQLYDIVFPF
jgi:flagellar L-ring protein precursor FlgH